jgi:hypothetical protein
MNFRKRPALVAAQLMLIYTIHAYSCTSQSLSVFIHRRLFCFFPPEHPTFNITRRILISLIKNNMALRSLIASTLAAQASAVWLAGVNIAGCEIGIDTSVRTIGRPQESQALWLT